MLNNRRSPVADNLVKAPANKNNNYWSPLSCLVKEQEEEEGVHMSANHLMLAVTNLQPQRLQNKIAAKWKRKLTNQSRLDTGCTLGAGARHDMDYFHDTGLPSKKVFMLPDKMKIKATNKIWLKHILQPKASEINVVPNFHSTLISVPKMADTDYIAVINKNEARIYDATTTIVSASNNPLLVAPRCQDTEICKLNLDYKVLGQEFSKQFIAGVDKAYAIFDLPNNQQFLLYHHTLMGFPPKRRFLAAVRAGNNTTWPGPTTTLISKHFLNLDKTKGTHERAAKRNLVNEGFRQRTHLHQPSKITTTSLLWCTSCWTRFIWTKPAHFQ
jgi:hypothetical protein